MKKNFKLTQRLLLFSAISLLVLGPSIARANHQPHAGSTHNQTLQQSQAHPCLLEPGLSSFRLSTHSPRRIVAKRIPEVPHHSRKLLPLKVSQTLGKLFARPGSLSPFVPQKFLVLRI